MNGGKAMREMCLPTWQPSGSWMLRGPLRQSLWRRRPNTETLFFIDWEKWERKCHHSRSDRWRSWWKTECSGGHQVVLEGWITAEQVEGEVKEGSRRCAVISSAAFVTSTLHRIADGRRRLTEEFSGEMMLKGLMCNSHICFDIQ